MCDNMGECHKLQKFHTQTDTTGIGVELLARILRVFNPVVAADIKTAVSIGATLNICT